MNDSNRTVFQCRECRALWRLNTDGTWSLLMSKPCSSCDDACLFCAREHPTADEMLARLYDGGEAPGKARNMTKVAGWLLRRLWRHCSDNALVRYVAPAGHLVGRQVIAEVDATGKASDDLALELPKEGDLTAGLFDRE